MNEREAILNEIREIPLGTLAKQVVGGSYTPGAHDTVLLERCKAMEERENRPDYTPEQQASQLFSWHSKYVIGQLSHPALVTTLTAIQARLDTNFNERSKS